MDDQEIEIPVPWGLIAAKAWGDKSSTKMLMVHGMLDNLESFNQLVPLLPQSFYYVAVDLPGHGKSSHFPKCSIVKYWDYIVAIRLVIRFLGDAPIILLGHSFGGSLVTFYTQLYPKEVSKLILIDTVYLYSNWEVDLCKSYMIQYIKEACDVLMKKPKLRKFEYHEGLSHYVSRRILGSITPTAALHLYKRTIVDAGDGKYQKGSDSRIKCSPYVIMDAITAERIMKKYSVVCPTLRIVAKNSDMEPAIKKLMDTFTTLTKNCVTVHVDGNHHVHINSPETVAPIINNFLKVKCLL
ncbi:serine hydrolase-like protein [Photinus pyralis]|uniref:AB hydrolase-1 domain-containing protein n=1 Tax=Photinus pyralis TaxID=7054 RepID=A0A1Y1LZ36_PHOPY|nr:serine hydrolase-like protein [Photinus pyralis]